MDRLEEIRQRAEKATPGPWMINAGGHHPMREISAPFAKTGTHSVALCRAVAVGGRGGAERDADFIASAREDILYLLAEYEKLERQNKELLTDNQRMHGKLSSLAAERQSHAFWATF